MIRSTLRARRGASLGANLFGLVVLIAIPCAVWFFHEPSPDRVPASPRVSLRWQPRQPLDVSGFSDVISLLKPWGAESSLAEVRAEWERIGYRNIAQIDARLGEPSTAAGDRFSLTVMRALLHNYEGAPRHAYEILSQLRAHVEEDEFLARQALYPLIYLQGVTALRRGETENCIQCRGESSCILPIRPAAVHTNPEGSQLAIRHFTEYLAQFPDDLAVKWLLNLAHMTLGEHPDRVDPRHVIDISRFRDSEFDIGRFRDVGHVVGLDRFNQLGGSIMDDFDGDGRLDIVVSTADATGPMGFFHNKGDGTFEDRSLAAGLTEQLGGIYCVQTDYNNDGHLDVLVVRGAWISFPVRPSLLRNNGNGTFTDVTQEAGLQSAANSISAAWADYDNDGWLDLFVCCERQPSRLYHNLRDGTFEEVLSKAGVAPGSRPNCKGVAWIDVDNDGFQDLFLTYLTDVAGSQLYRNNRDGTFDEITAEAGISGPVMGFSCWAFDYDNDGWLDLFATSYDKSLPDVVQGLIGQPHGRHSNRLYRNRQGEGFEDQTAKTGLDLVFATMGSNFGDFDNDGYLDMYLGTGDPDIATLVPNRMFKNVAGKRFAEITGSSGTGNLQKGHAVACGDWDQDGDIDIFAEMGGSTPGDKYHNILFQNPGQKHHWLTVKVVGKQSNRPAIGARIRVITAGAEPRSIYRSVGSGSSFGASPLQQTIGLGDAERIDTLEIDWPTSRTTQTFRDLAVDQALEIVEFDESWKPLDLAPIPLPE